MGQVEARLESDSPAAASQKKVLDHTQIVPQGIKLDELAQTIKTGNPGFQQKSNTGTKIFIILMIVIGVGALLGLAWVLFGGSR
jgi:hypothetical protein